MEIKGRTLSASVLLQGPQWPKRRPVPLQLEMSGMEVKNPRACYQTVRLEEVKPLRSLSRR